ncbi:MAG: DUF547 domain-containing protein [Acidobacteriota bacterium]
MPVSIEPRAPALVALILSVLAACGGPAAERARGEVAAAVQASLDSGSRRFEHPEWDRLLAGGTREGLVDYTFMQDHRAGLEAYLARVAGARLDRLAPAHLEALLINAYNAYTVQSILEHPEVSSIRQIDGVWTKRRHRVGGFDLTLDEIEHNLLRPFFRDPRIHFVVNCASRSCAPLPGWAIDGDRIDEQLEERARSFLRDPRNARVEGRRLALSKYFDWYRADFTAEGWRGAAATIPEYVARYAAPEVAGFIRDRGGKPAVRFLDYDWSLNAALPPDAARSGDRPG